MKNLVALSNNEVKNINGGHDYYEDGNGGCTTGPIIIITTTTGPTFPDPDTIFGS